MSSLGPYITVLLLQLALVGFSKVSRMSTVSVMVRVCVRITVSINVMVVQLVSFMG